MFFRLPWTIHGEMCASVFNNPEDLMKLWIWSLNNIKDTKRKTRIIGASANMNSSNFMFACKLVELLLRETDMLPQTLKEKSVLIF